MAHHDHSLTPDRDARASGGLLHAHDMSDFKLPEGDPDPRGWDVRTADGQKLGKVEDLLIDTATGRVRYLEVAVDKDVVKAGGREYALVPVGSARLDDDRDDVVMNLNLADVAGIPAYERGRVSREYEQSLRTFVRERPARSHDATPMHTHAGATGAALGSTDTDFYTGPEYDDRSFFASRGRTTGGAGPVDRAEGALARGAHRAGNALDDVKDRIDGDPASRPGPDATDRHRRL
jgi:hypothetical protein